MVSTIGRLKSCLDVHLAQIVCDKDEVVDWCIVLLEMPLTRSEECWSLPKESLPELPQNLNIVTLTLTLWPINSDVLISLHLPHLSSSLTYSLPSLNPLCHSKTDVRFMQDGLNHSIRFCGIFPSLKQDFIAYRSCKVSDSIFEIRQLCCSFSFETEVIKVGQSSPNMYSNNILNFQESITILDTHTEKV